MRYSWYLTLEIVWSWYPGIPLPIQWVNLSLRKSFVVLLNLFVGSTETYYLYASLVLTKRAYKYYGSTVRVYSGLDLVLCK